MIDGSPAMISRTIPPTKPVTTPITKAGTGGTNIGEGLTLGYTQASLPSIPEDAVRVVFLVSDGRATDGVTHRERLSRLASTRSSRGSRRAPSASAPITTASS